MTMEDPTPARAEIVATCERALAGAHARMARLAPLLARTRDARVVEGLIRSELDALLVELAADASPIARRALLGLPFPEDASDRGRT